MTPVASPSPSPHHDRQRAKSGTSGPAYHSSANLLLFTVAGDPEADAGGRLALLRLDGGSRSWTTLVAGVGMAGAVSPDALVFSRGSEMQAVAFDARRLGIAGAPQTVMSNVSVAHGAGQFAVSAAGALLSIDAALGAELPPLFWWTATAPGKQEDAVRGRDLKSASVSQDGRRAVGIDRADGTRPDIWIADLERGTALRLTHGGVNAAPVWSPDGASVFYASTEGGVFAIFRRDAESLHPAQRVYSSSEHAFPSSVSSDGTLLAFISRDRTTGADIWGLPVKGGAAQPLVRTPFDDVAAALSPAGHLLAYQSNDAGRWEVYVHRLADARRVTVSSDGGTHPFWSADGRWLFFRSRGRLMRAAVSSGGDIGSPELVTGSIDAAPIGVDASGRVLFQRRAPLPADVAVLALQWARELRPILGPPSTALPR